MLEFIYIISIVSIAGFSYELAYGKLANYIKTVFKLEQQFKYHPLLYINPWKKALGNFYLMLLPFILLLILYRNIHKGLYELLRCPYCIGFHLMWITNHFVFNMNWLMTFLLASVIMLPIAIIDRLRI